MAFTLMLIGNAVNVSGAIESINYPHNNDIITYTNNIPLDVSSSGSTGCYMTYTTSTGDVALNQSITCNGISSIDLPNSNGVYNLTAWDDSANSQTITITVSKPSGILITLIYALSFVILLGMLFMFIIILGRFVMLDVTIYNVALSWTFYFGLLVAYQLNEEYAAVPFVLNWLDLIMSIGGWLLFAFPLIAFVISLIKKGTDKKNVPTPQSITGGNLLNYG